MTSQPLPTLAYLPNLLASGLVPGGVDSLLTSTVPIVFANSSLPEVPAYFRENPAALHSELNRLRPTFNPNAGPAQLFAELPSWAGSIGTPFEENSGLHCQSNSPGPAEAKKAEDVLLEELGKTEIAEPRRREIGGQLGYQIFQTSDFETLLLGFTERLVLREEWAALESLFFYAGPRLT